MLGATQKKAKRVCVTDLLDEALSDAPDGLRMDELLARLRATVPAKKQELFLTYSLPEALKRRIDRGKVRLELSPGDQTTRYVLVDSEASTRHWPLAAAIRLVRRVHGFIGVVSVALEGLELRRCGKRSVGRLRAP